MMANHLSGTSGQKAAFGDELEPTMGTVASTRASFVRTGGFILPLSIGALLGWFGYSVWQDMSKQAEPGNILEVNGRIETDEIHISAAMNAQVKSVLVREGSPVRKGQTVLTLDSRPLVPKVDQTNSVIQAALSAQSEADQQVALIQSEIDEARSKSNGVFVRMFTSKQGRKKKENELRRRMMEAKMMQFQAKEALAKARSAKAEISSKLSYFNITSPIDGTCNIKNVEAGEMVKAGQILLVISNPKSVYMKGFIPEGNLSQIKIGQKAEVYLDAPDKNPLSARIVAIDVKPSFTPENIYFKQDRVRQVFGIRLAIDYPDGRAKAGMPAEAKIILGQEKKL